MRIVYKGGPGSGHHEHDGRLGGGSLPYLGSMAWHRDGGALGAKGRWRTKDSDISVQQLKDRGGYLNPDQVGYNKKFPIWMDLGQKGGDSVSMIIQSILLPKGVTFDQLVAQKGLEFLNDANTESKKDFERYTRYEQLPVEKFDKESLKLVKVGEAGAYVIGGKLIDPKAVEKALTMNLTKKEEDGKEVEMKEIQEPSSFEQMFYGELSSLVDVVQGVMGQSGRDSASRKSDILKASDAFGAFISMSLDALGTAAVKMNPAAVVVESSKEGGEEMEGLFKTKEEFVAAMGEAFAPVLKEIKDAIVAKQGSEALSVEDLKKMNQLMSDLMAMLQGSEGVGSPASMAGIAKEVKDLGEKVTAIVGKVDKIGEGLGAEIGVIPPKEELEDVQPKAGESVFKGMFLKRK